MHAEQDRWAHNTGSATLFQYRRLRNIANNAVTTVVTYPEQRTDLVAEYLDDVGHPMAACGVPVVSK